MVLGSLAFGTSPPTLPVAAYTTAPNISATDYVTNLPAENSGLGVGPVGLAFDTGGNLFVTDYIAGIIFRFPPGGGTAYGSFSQFAGTRPTGLAFTKDGHLFMGHQGYYGPGDVVEVDPATLAITRTLSPAITGATGLAVDPLSGDLFAGGPGVIFRISNFANGAPGTVSTYANVQVDGIVFGPDGTLYGAGTQGAIYSFPATSQPSSGPWAGTLVATVLNSTGGAAPVDGIGVGAGGSPGKPPFLYVNRNDGVITKVDLTTSPPTASDIVTGGTRGDLVTVNSQGCLFATQSETIVKIADAGGNCNPPLVPTGTVSPPRKVVFVHGINDNFARVAHGLSWDPLLSQVRAKFGTDNVTYFGYFQDFGFDVSRTCTSRPADTNVGRLALNTSDPRTLKTDLCDSKSALAIDSALLDDDLRSSSAPTSVIADSMGGAITRGWLTLAQDPVARPADPTLSLVDSVVFIQGAHQGAFLNRIGQWLNKNGSGSGSMVGPTLVDLARWGAVRLGFDPTREGIINLAPDSKWYQSVNPTPVPPNIHYFNFYSDIRINGFRFDLLGATWQRDDPNPISVGDTVLLTGTDPPSDHQLSGGARFQPSPASGFQRLQFVAKDDVILTWSNFTGPVMATTLMDQPMSHYHYGENMANPQVFTVEDTCNPPPTTRLVTPTQKILEILNDPAHPCK